MTSYTIVDPRPIRQENPHSFYLPCDARLAAIAPGDHVKAIFQANDPEDGAERMWIEVISTTEETLTGTLANQPLGIPGLDHGDTVTIQRTDVINIETTRADDPAETNGQDDTLFHRCLMDMRVYADKAAPVRIVRDAPQPADYGITRPEMFPWGGWRVLGEGFEEGMPTETGTPVIAVRIDPRMAPLFAAAPGSAFELVDGEWTRTA